MENLLKLVSPLAGYKLSLKAETAPFSRKPI